MSREIMKWPEFNGKYSIGSDGSVYSNDYNHTGRRKKMKPYRDNDGYPCVYFTVKKVRYKRVIHRMVALLFVENPLNKTQVNHKNGIRNDNRKHNLEWVTSRENCIHGWNVNGRTISEEQKLRMSIMFSGENNPNAKMSTCDEILISDMRRSGIYLKDIAMLMNLSTAQVSVISRRHKHLLS